MTSFFGWTIPPIVYTIGYGVMFVGAAVFMIVIGRRHAPTARREPFRKPALMRAAGWLLLSAAAIINFMFDGIGNGTGSGPAWTLPLELGLGAPGIALLVIGTRAYLRAGEAYPQGKHADLSAPPDRGHRGRLLD